MAEVRKKVQLKLIQFLPLALRLQFLLTQKPLMVPFIEVTENHYHRKNKKQTVKNLGPHSRPKRWGNNNIYLGIFLAPYFITVGGINFKCIISGRQTRIIDTSDTIRLYFCPTLIVIFHPITEIGSRWIYKVQPSEF